MRFLLAFVMMLMCEVAVGTNFDLDGLIQLDAGDNSEIIEGDGKEFVHGLNFRRIKLQVKVPKKQFDYRISAQLDEADRFELHHAYVRYKKENWYIQIGFQKNEANLTTNISSKNLISLERPHYVASLEVNHYGLKYVYRWEQIRLATGVFLEKSLPDNPDIISPGGYLRLTKFHNISEGLLVHGGFSYQDDDPNKAQKVNTNSRKNKLFFNRGKEESIYNRQQMFAAEAVLLWGGFTGMMEWVERRMYQLDLPETTTFASYNQRTTGGNLTLAYNFSQQIRSYDEKKHTIKGIANKDGGLGWEVFLSASVSETKLGPDILVNEITYSGGLTVSLNKRLKLINSAGYAKSEQELFLSEKTKRGMSYISRLQASF